MYSINKTNRRTGKWTEDEDIKLKDAVQKHGGKDWDAIAALVPGRMRNQCHHRWHNALDPNIDQTNERSGKWTGDEDIKLKEAVRLHGGKGWIAIAALVPGRTREQCHTRWRNNLRCSIDGATRRRGKWTEEEDIKLKDSVHTHAGKDWAAIGALVPGRTRYQCHTRWYNAFESSINLVTGRTGKWTEDEDTKLKDSVHMHGGKDLAAIAALVPGRTRTQCLNRWYKTLDQK
jgi:hypothetical protein